MSRSPSALPCGYEPAKARGKRPVPMWADRFLRDTMDLSAEEIGAYHLVLYAMWKRPECELPHNDSRLARIARVSTRRWRSQIGPAILDLMEVENGIVTSKKLREEASQTEQWCISQHARKCEACKKRRENGDNLSTAERGRKGSEKSCNQLKTLNAGLTGDETPEKPANQPGMNLPKDPTYIGGGGSAGAREPDPPPLQGEIQTEREILLDAIGADPISGMIGPGGVQLGRMSDMIAAKGWREDLGLSVDEVASVIREVMAAKRDGPPSTFSYFNKAMQRYAGSKSGPRLAPINGGSSERDHRAGQFQGRNSGAGSSAGRAHESLVAAFVRSVPDEPGGGAGDP